MGQIFHSCCQHLPLEFVVLRLQRSPDLVLAMHWRACVSVVLVLDGDTGGCAGVVCTTELSAFRSDVCGLGGPHTEQGR